MDTQKLVILGILTEGPQHGYEIKKIIQKELVIFSSLDNKSIYYPLKMMEKEGLIHKSTAKGRGRPLRYVYSISSRGKREFSRLARQALLSQKRPFIEIDIPLYFLPYLNAGEVLPRLRLRKRFLEKVKTWLVSRLNAEPAFSPHKKLLLRHHLNLLDTEDTFLEEITGIVKNYEKSSHHR